MKTKKILLLICMFFVNTKITKPTLTIEEKKISNKMRKLQKKISKNIEIGKKKLAEGFALAEKQDLEDLTKKEKMRLASINKDCEKLHKKMMIDSKKLTLCWAELRKVFKTTPKTLDNHTKSESRLNS